MGRVRQRRAFTCETSPLYTKVCGYHTRGFKKSFTVVFQMLLRGECYENVYTQGGQTVHRPTVTTNRCSTCRMNVKRATMRKQLSLSTVHLQAKLSASQQLLSACQRRWLVAAPSDARYLPSSVLRGIWIRGGMWPYSMQAYLLYETQSEMCTYSSLTLHE
jgi:hypothetical protein